MELNRSRSRLDLESNLGSSTQKHIFVLKEKKDTSKDGKGSIDDSAFEALERDFQEVRSLERRSRSTSHTETISSELH